MGAGVVANLAVWFALQVLFHAHAPFRAGPIRLDLPVLSSIDWTALGLAVLAALCMFRFRLGVMPTLGITAVAGLVVRLILMA